MKRRKKTHLNVLFGLALVWVHPKTAKTTSSTTGALVSVGSQQAEKKKTISFSVAHLVFVDEVSHPILFYVELLNSRESSLVNLSLRTNLVGPYGVELNCL